MVMIYPHTIRYGQSNQPGEYDVAHDPTYIYIHLAWQGPLKHLRRLEGLKPCKRQH